MTSKSYFPYKTLFVFLIAACEIERAVGESEILKSNCSIEFTDEEAKRKLFQECATKHKHEYKIVNITVEEYQEEMNKLESNKFDDNCFTKCWYDTFEMVDKNGKIVMDSFDKYFKSSNISAPLLKEISSVFSECVKETELKFKDAKEIPCKMYAMNEFCYFNKLKGNIKHLDELCYK
ncbi:unnamed protein product [Orchesella dallaii]|uniref:Uncharacterized protein n=1 Tax=Orchesella dallaii TaxID=48710 RepID=A0ABP1QSS3_9HEXA